MFAFYHVKVLSKNWKTNIFLREICKLGQKYFHITVVHVHVNVFPKIQPACHSDANGIEPGSDQK